MCRFIESIRIENRQPSLLHLHQERMNRTFESFGKVNPISLVRLAGQLSVPSDEVYKWRVVYDTEGVQSNELIKYTITPILTFELVEAKNLNYHFKYEDRYDFGKLKSGSAANEVIITQNGLITDTTFSNLIFLRAGEWFTPGTFLLNGVMRQHLLKTGKIKEVRIGVGDLKEYSAFLIINALRPTGTNIYSIGQIQNL